MRACTSWAWRRTLPLLALFLGLGLVVVMSWPSHAWFAHDPVLLRWVRAGLARDGLRWAVHVVLFTGATWALGMGLAPLGRMAPLLAALLLALVALGRDGAPLFQGTWLQWSGPAVDLWGDITGLVWGAGLAWIWSPPLQRRASRIPRFWLRSTLASLWWSAVVFGVLLTLFPMEAWASQNPETWRWFRWVFQSDWVQWAFHGGGFALAAFTLGMGLHRRFRWWTAWVVLLAALLAVLQEGVQMHFLGFRGWTGLGLDFVADALGTVLGLLGVRLARGLLPSKNPSSKENRT